MDAANIWKVATVDEQPSLTMVRWSIYETTINSRHLVGFCLENQEGRVSSAIITFDFQALRCRTFSGRVYQLEGPPGYDTDGVYVWKCWTAFTGLLDWTDVTGAVLLAESRNPGPSVH